MRWTAVFLFTLALLGGRVMAADKVDGPEPLTVKINEKELPTSPGYHTFHGTIHFGKRDIPFGAGVFLPPMYFETKNPMPVVVTLHNRGPMGHSGQGIFYEGLASMLAEDHPDTRGTGEAPKNPIIIRTQAAFIGIAPQCPSEFAGWEAPPMGAYVAALTEAIAERYHGDLDRVYLTGFSYGGSSTWRIAMQVPGFFAAIAPLDGRATPDPVHDLKRLKDVGIFVGVGSVDTRFLPEAERMRDALIALKHPSYIYTLVAGGNHWSYGCTYSDQNFWYWMFMHRRGGKIDTSNIITIRPAASAATLASTTNPAEAPIVDVDELGPKVTSPTPTAQATVLCQYYRDIPGAQIEAMMRDPSYPRYPTQQMYLDRMEIPPDQPPGYGTVLRGLLHPPADGEYRFYIASDNESEIWLSPDDKRDEKTLHKIASVTDWSLPRNWTRKPEQESKPIALKAGTSYYIEVRHKSGGGDNHLSVAWKLPDGTMEAPIGGNRIGPVPLVPVPEAQVSQIQTPRFPSHPGTYRMRLTVDDRGRQVVMPVLVTLPKNFSSVTASPVMIYLADTAAAPDGEGFRMTGPAKELSEGGSLAAWSPFIVIAPQCPTAQPYDAVDTQEALMAVCKRLLDDLPIDPQQVYLTGNGAGATASWHLAAALHDRIAALSPILTGFIPDPKLHEALDGMAIHIVTGVKDGMATDAANRMKDQLAACKPAPDVAYEMEMGDETASVYYAKQAYYQWFLQWRRAEGKPAQAK